MAREVNKKWFTEAIKNAGFKNKKNFADLSGLDSTKFSNILSGARSMKPAEIDRFAKMLQKSPVDIREALGETIEVFPTMQISGYVGAADRVILYDNSQDFLEEEEVVVPFFYYKGKILEVRGESMLPRYNPGEIIGITPPKDSIIHTSLIGKDVVACVDDDRLLLKILHQGSKPDLYTLISLNSNVPPVIDIKLVWATSIDFLIPKARYSA